MLGTTKKKKRDYRKGKEEKREKKKKKKSKPTHLYHRFHHRCLSHPRLTHVRASPQRRNRPVPWSDSAVRFAVRGSSSHLPSRLSRRRRKEGTDCERTNEKGLPGSFFISHGITSRYDVNTAPLAGLATGSDAALPRGGVE